MVDFKKLVQKKSVVNYKNLLVLFESLDRQTSHIDLRPTQQEALKLLTENRDKKNLILKLSTGAGKTSIALIYLYSLMEQYKEPVVYLCPTRQLSEQVYFESEKLGIKAVIYPAGEPHPHVDGILAKSIIICTYDKLFNAKTTFDRNDVMLRPCAFVLDDAHAGVEEIRDSFTLNITKGPLLEEVTKIIDEPLRAYKAGIWADIINKDPNQSLEIPFWIMHPLLQDLEKLLSKYISEEEYKFKIPYLRDLLRLCRCVVSGKGIELIPEILPLYKSQAFVNAKHLLFMSATLADDSVLVREFDCDIESAQNPIIPKNDKGMGERMVLAPSLVNKSLNRNWVMKLCMALSKKVRVVVLSSSEARAREWETFGASVFMRDHVTNAVKDLKTHDSNLKFAVFVQRYDGIDLPDNACRVLVLDGIPTGEGIIDKHDNSLSSVAAGTRNRLVYRIEQGMGRTVRSHADYSVILLVGPELAHFIAKHDVLFSMNKDTQAQLKLAIDLSELAIQESDSQPGKAVIDMIRKCLKRDEGWKQFYNETIRDPEKGKINQTDNNRIFLAFAERKAFESALIGDYQQAVNGLRDSINKYIINDSFTKGWYLQRVANYLYEIDPGESFEVQRSAYENNKSMCCPPSIVKRPLKTDKLNTLSILIDWFKQFENPNGAIAYIEELRTRLSFNSSPAKLEQALLDLAPLLGAQGSRPERDMGVGPDDLWLWEDISLVIEAKNQNQDSLHKRDAGQLLLSIDWFNKTYINRKNFIPMIAAKVTISDKHSGFPNNTRVFTPINKDNLLTSVEKLLYKMTTDSEIISDGKRLHRLLNSFHLTANNFINNFTEPLIEQK